MPSVIFDRIDLGPGFWSTGDGGRTYQSGTVDIAAGRCVFVMLRWAGASNANPCSRVYDDAGNEYTAITSGQNVTGPGQAMAAFVKQNAAAMTGGRIHANFNGNPTGGAGFVAGYAVQYATDSVLNLGAFAFGTGVGSGGTIAATTSALASTDSNPLVLVMVTANDQDRTYTCTDSASHAYTTRFPTVGFSGQGGAVFETLPGAAFSGLTITGASTNGNTAVSTLAITFGPRIGTPLPIPPPPGPITDCTPQADTGSGGRGAAGCNNGGTGWDTSYTGPLGDVADHADPPDGETLTGKRGIEIWAELVHTDASGQVTTFRRAVMPLGHDADFEGGYKEAGLVEVGAIDHAIGNEQGGYEPAAVTVTFTDVFDNFIRKLLRTDQLEGDELRIKVASDASAGIP